MVENGKGGDFFGYYYMSSSSGEMPVKRKTHPINENTTNSALPQGERQSQTVFHNQNTRHQEIYPTPLQGREKSGNTEDQVNPGRGPCFNCKEYGHYTRDCPEVCGLQDICIKQRYYSPQQEDILSRSSKTETYPRHHYPPSQNPYYTEHPDSFTQRPGGKYQYKDCRKNDDEEGYPLSDFEENIIPSSKNMVPGKNRNHFRVKPERQPSDSDGDESNDDTYTLQKPSNTILDTSQQVNDVLFKLVEHQAAMQDNNLKVMETLVNRSTNAFVLDDIPVFDGLKGSIHFKNWLLELDKAVEVTGINISELAFSKSSRTPHKMIKRLRREKTWEFIKEKLQITYSKLTTDIHASTDLNQNKQRRHEPLEDFIERFYQNYK